MTIRAWHAVVVVLVGAGLLVQVLVTVTAHASPTDLAPGDLQGASLAGRLIRLFSFFTEDSNVLAAVVASLLLLRPDRDGAIWRALRLVSVVAIAVTGIVYSTVLVWANPPHGAVEIATNAIFHVIVPVMMVAGWLIFGPRPAITPAALATAVLFPVGWLVYTLLRGAIWHWYPYSFLQVPTRGYPVVLLNAALVTALAAALSGAFLIGDRRLTPARP